MPGERRKLKKFKRNRRVFANFTVQENHLILDMALAINEEAGTTVRLLAMAALKLLLNRREKHAAAGDYIMACLGKGVRVVDFVKLTEEMNKKRGTNGALQVETEDSGSDGRVAGGVPESEGMPG